MKREETHLNKDEKSLAYAPVNSTDVCQIGLVSASRSCTYDDLIDIIGMKDEDEHLLYQHWLTVL